MINDTMKNLPGSSSGRMTKIADFCAQKVSASISVSKQRSCSSSVSRNTFSRDSAVDMTLAIACGEVLSAAPANHRALCSPGSKRMSC